MTTFAAEQAKHERWKAAAWPGFPAALDELVVREFWPAVQHRAWEAQALADAVRFAVTNVPYYRTLFANLRLTPADVASPADLPKLPILRKETLVEQFAAMQSPVLPKGDAPGGVTKSSGTTGRPVTVAQSRASQWMFTALWVRQARWFDFEPAGVFLEARIPSEVRYANADRPAPAGTLLSLPYWRYLGDLFRTGYAYGLNSTEAIDQQVAWLRKVQPTYAMTYPGVLEEWALAAGGRSPVESLKVVFSIGSQMTASLRARLEAMYGIPVHQTYGLNEVGKVAFRCAAGRYHVNTEHCLVEIADAAGRPCEPGETGHLLATTLRNPAMPLIRYDTGDMARVAAGPCPCGRTLPSFADVEGRFRRFAGLPPGSRTRVNGLIAAVESFPPEQSGFLRRYQIHQDKDNRYTLRVYAAGPVPEAFRDHVRKHWDSQEGVPGTLRGVTETEEIVNAPSGKRLDFVSELTTDAYATPPSGEE